MEDEDAGFLHEVVVAWLIRVLGTWLLERGGFVGASDARFGVSRTRGRKPDLSVYFARRRPPAQGLVTLPPDITIVDPGDRTFEVFELGADGRYARALGAAEGSLSSVPGCDGSTLDLDALWAETERLEA